LKTGLEANDVRRFIADSEDEFDAYFVCPQPEIGAVFLNPVLGSEFTDPGALATVQKSLNKMGLNIDMRTQVMDASELVYSNYVIAKPQFWRQWLDRVNAIYVQAEQGEDTQLQSELVKPTHYGGNAQRKVFLVECLASVLFVHEKMKVKSIPIDNTKAAKGVMYPYFEAAMVCDRLKTRFKQTGEPKYLEDFQNQSAEILSKFIKPAAAEWQSQIMVPKTIDEMPIVVAVATRQSQENFDKLSATGRSLSNMTFPDVSIRLFPENSTGLSTLYNRVIEEYMNQDVILVFAHDDLYFLDLFWPKRLREGLSQFDLTGIVGNRKRHPMQPSWAFLDVSGTWDVKENLSGSVAHGHAFPPESFAEFGPTGQVSLLDGLLMAATSQTLKNTGLRFDERFDFHFYDMDMCRSAEQRDLKIGTIPLSLMHESKGGYSNPSWLQAYQAYIEKWND